MAARSSPSPRTATCSGSSTPARASRIPTGASGFTEQGNNSGNQIGRGFTDFRHLFGGSTDHGGRARIFYGVKNNGDLLFWRYAGNGEQDPTGAAGFDTPFQGTQIGNGF